MEHAFILADKYKLVLTSVIMFCREYESSHRTVGFDVWFYHHVSELCKGKDAQLTKELISLARGPLCGVERFHGYVINGFRFHTRDHESQKAKQNSGILLRGLLGSKAMDYYGVISEIMELQYLGGNRVVMFKCDWWDVDNIGKGVKMDRYGFVSVNTTRKLLTDEPFALASQVEQVFYVEDGSNPNWLVVLKGQSQSSFDSLTKDPNDVQSGDQEEAFQQDTPDPIYPNPYPVQDDELIGWEEDSNEDGNEMHVDSDDDSHDSEISAYGDDSDQDE
ncbi:unnamed protein product [Linum tenue]|uniref:DUF4216 domain-containing protein n=1 Tax=Linum tenue TaxID=586396 RepID=A0AAV0P1M9_9ROSI|nr:unnamed protein product [Linum tenue]